MFLILFDNMVVSVFDFIKNKDWDYYPFIPPLFSLFISVFLVPVYNRLYEKTLLRFLDFHQMPDKFSIISGTAQDVSLQMGYLTGIPSFISSLVATLKSDHPVLLSTIVLILLIPMLRLMLVVFLQEPGYHSTTRFPEKTKPKVIFNFGWTYLIFYTFILAIFNISLIIITILALPSRK